MKEKTSITLSSDLLAALDRLIGSRSSRSAFIEAILRRYVHERERRRLAARDLELLNRTAETLNSEAADVLDYQFHLE